MANSDIIELRKNIKKGSLAMTYNKIPRQKKFKHLTYKERKLIDKWLKDKMPKAQIAKLLGISRSTLYNEIKQGSVVQKRADLTTYTKYFAQM